ncbi:hypothetical protein FQA39_LY10011 [Lamprigera yunnana]|nr:hypothetical protein FQA39_LY10011 [Lamprigera yunnana]
MGYWEVVYELNSTLSICSKYVVFIFTLVPVVLLYILIIKPFKYWKNKGVVQYSVCANLRDTLLAIISYRPVSESIEKIYNDFSYARYCGHYQFSKPMLLIRDLELIKQITVKDFDNFMDHTTFFPEDTEPLWGKNLISLTGDKWRHMRATLSPSFTSSKMKFMFQSMSEYAENFVKFFEEQSGTITLEMKDIFTRFTNDIIATSAFGINCDSMRNPDNEFYKMGKDLTNFSDLLRQIKIFLLIIMPRLLYKLGLRFISTNVSTFFTTIVKENLKNRETNNIVRSDMVQLLMEARKNTNKVYDDGVQRKTLTDEDITAQVLIFFFAGFESVSMLMCFMAHELAVNVDIQERLQSEIDDALIQHEGILSYETLSKLTYMNMVLSGKKWPVSLVSDRICTEPFTITSTNNSEIELHLKKGDLVMIPTFAIHRDSKYYVDPQRFDPERFNDENKYSVPQYGYLPFGLGSRNCIGNRFALMETKLLFFYLLSKFNLVVIDKTRVPLKLANNSFQVTSKDGFWLGLTSRKKLVN